MICLDNTDTLEGGASVNAVVDYTVHGLVGTTFTNLAQGQLSSTDPSVLYTAAAAISVVSVVFVNTHSAAVTVNLYLDPANAGTPRRLIPKTLSLAIGYSMHFDGAKLTILDTNGGVVSGINVSDTAYDATSWDGVATIAPSKNAVRDKIEITVPTGMVASFALTSAPTGWLECDGSAVSRTTYNTLFAALGVIYGNGDGSTTFNLPDYRGRFLRGYDHGAGTDPDAATRTDRGDGTAGDNVGTKQADEFKSHVHMENVRASGSASQWRALATDTDSVSPINAENTDATGGNETRPVNICVMYCIKY